MRWAKRFIIMKIDWLLWESESEREKMFWKTQLINRLFLLNLVAFSWTTCFVCFSHFSFLFRMIESFYFDHFFLYFSLRETNSLLKTLFENYRLTSSYRCGFLCAIFPKNQLKLWWQNVSGSYSNEWFLWMHFRYVNYRKLFCGIGVTADYRKKSTLPIDSPIHVRNKKFASTDASNYFIYNNWAWVQVEYRILRYLFSLSVAAAINFIFNLKRSMISIGIFHQIQTFQSEQLNEKKKKQISRFESMSFVQSG